MNDNSTKSLMVDERQLARDVLDNLFEKTHCDCNVDWCLYEIYPELQIGKSQFQQLTVLQKTCEFFLLWVLVYCEEEFGSRLSRLPLHHFP